jgi:hypothetical protein
MERRTGLLPSHSCTKEKEHKSERKPCTKQGFRISFLFTKKIKGGTQRNRNGNT